MTIRKQYGIIRQTKPRNESFVNIIFGLISVRKKKPRTWFGFIRILEFDKRLGTIQSDYVINN